MEEMKMKQILKREDQMDRYWQKETEKITEIIKNVTLQEDIGPEAVTDILNEVHSQ